MGSPVPALDEWVRPGATLWWWCLGAAVIGRSADLFSTWLATPRLELEGNPLARWLGWRGGVLLNLVVAPLVACWPMLAISVATTSCLVAARNFQQAWLMRTMGEDRYRLWFAMRVADAPRRLVFGCHMAEAALTGGVGAILMWLGPEHVVSFGIGLGVAAYGFAIAVFTGWSLLRAR